MGAVIIGQVQARLAWAELGLAEIIKYGKLKDQAFHLLFCVKHWVLSSSLQYPTMIYTILQLENKPYFSHEKAYQTLINLIISTCISSCQSSSHGRA